MKDFSINELKHRVDLYNKEANEIIKIKTIWAQIESLNDYIIIRIRKENLKEPSINYYFLLKNMKFEILSYIPDFKRNSYWEFKCKLVNI